MCTGRKDAPGNGRKVKQMRKYIFENALQNLNCDSITTKFVNFLFDDSNSLICVDFVIYELGSCNDVIESAEFLKTLLLDYIEENLKQGVFESFINHLSTIAIESIDFVKIALLFEGYIGAHNPTVSSLPIAKPINGAEYIENLIKGRLNK